MNLPKTLKRFIFAFRFAWGYAYKTDQWKKFDKYMSSKGMK